VDAASKPFFVNGDTPWSLMVQTTREQADQYLEDRRLKGINAVLVNLIEHEFANNAPRNAYGDAPFTKAGDFSTPNEAYFAHVDYVINKAAEKGILVLLAPAYLGYAGASQGWYQEMLSNGTTKLTTFGQYVGSRYKNFKNILWVEGGDFNAPNKAVVRAVAEGIKSVDNKPHTFHGDRGTAAEQWMGGESWLNVNNIYTDDATVVSAAFGQYAASTKPFFLIEAIYENMSNANAWTVRQQAYQAVLSGASGHMMGNDPMWYMGSGWQNALNSAGAKSLKHIANLFATHEWWKLVPDRAGVTLTAGTLSGAYRSVAAVASDASFAIAYMPSKRSITIDMSKLSGPKVKAQWVDPTSGTATSVSGSPFLASGTRSLSPTTNNGSGDGDWLLVLESTP
jgi:hypothetical protein